MTRALDGPKANQAAQKLHEGTSRFCDTVALIVSLKGHEASS